MHMKMVKTRIFHMTPVCEDTRADPQIGRLHNDTGVLHEGGWDTREKKRTNEKNKKGIVRPPRRS